MDKPIQAPKMVDFISSAFPGADKAMEWAAETTRPVEEATGETATATVDTSTPDGAENAGGEGVRLVPASAQ